MPDPVSVGVVGGTWNRYTHRFTIPAVEVQPGSTMVLMMTSQGAYANVDSGPLAGQFDAEFQLSTFPRAFNVVDEVATRIFCPFTEIQNWPDPTYVGPYTGIYYTDPAPPATVMLTEHITVVAVGGGYIDIIRGPDAIPHPTGSFIILDNPYVLTDTGNPPPLLNVPGDPTAAPARTSSWWAQVTGTGTVDPAFSLWDSHYWQSAPSVSVARPETHPLWSTLSMVARRADGTETSSGLLTPVVDPITGFTRYDLIVEMQGAWPTEDVFQHGCYLITMTPTTEVLPIPDIFGDIVQFPDSAPTDPPDPRYPPFAFTYPASQWFRWISSLGMNNTDVFLPVLLSQGRYDALNIAQLASIKGFHDATGAPYDPEGVPPFDDPVELPLDQLDPAGGFYSIRRQVGRSVFNTTHDPNPIVDELTHIGDLPLARGGIYPFQGASRVPVVGQMPWWEVAQMKAGPPQMNNGTSVMASPPDPSSGQQLSTGDIMFLIAQSDGVGAPTLGDDTGWTAIPALTGPNPNSHQPVIISTSVAADAPAGSTSISIAMNNVLALPPPPLVVDIAERTYYDSELGMEVTLPAETVVATSYHVDAFIVLDLGGATGGHHIGGTPMTIQGATPVLALDQYVAAWWKIAEGEPPNVEGPRISTEAAVTVNFPDGTRCGAQLFGIVADPINPFSLEFGTSLDSMTRIDYPGAVQTLEVIDVNPEDAITCRGAVFLMMGYCKVGTAYVGDQDIRSQSARTGIIGATEIGTIGHLPLFMWDAVGPDSIGCAVYVAFRGYRDRVLARTIGGLPEAEYEKVDGHYAPTLLNKGVLPPCAGGTTTAGDSFRGGYGISYIPFHAHGTGTPVTWLQMENQTGTTAYLHAWVASDGMPLPCTGYIFQRDPMTGIIVTQEIWFTAVAGEDQYIDPPSSPGFYTSDKPYGVRVDVDIPTEIEEDTYFGLQVWSEEDCQDPGVGVFGLGAGFRYKAEQLSIASSQQASIVG